MADDGDRTNITGTNEENESNENESNENESNENEDDNNVELVSLKTDKKGEDKNDDDNEEKKSMDWDSASLAKQTIHEDDSEDSKQYYKLDDFELEYEVAHLKERFEKLVEEYSDFDEDIYNVTEKELMDILGNLAIDSYGILLWILCMDQLETERKKIIWDILIFLAMRMPTQVAMDLLIHYSSNMARYSPTDVSELGKSLVHGSQFPLATCLVLSAFFVDAAKKDLTRDKQLRALSQEYAIRATTILEEIENDYLAVIMLETPSFHDSKSPLEIALENDIIDFLACNKVSRISNAMWTLPNLMEVGSDTSSAFALSDWGAADIHSALLEDSYSFYFSSMGYFTVEVIAYLLYLAVFTYLTYQRDPVNQAPTWLDYIFWCCNFGFVLGELIELGYDGWKEYLSKWQNWLDMIISTNFMLIIIIRSSVTIVSDNFDDVKKIVDQEASVIPLIYKNIWALNVVILWLRLLFFMLMSRSVGPLITNIKNMLKDIVSFGKMYILILLGFVFGLYFLIGGENRNVLFTTVDKSVVTLIKTTLGQLEWECVRDIELEGTATSSSSSSSSLSSNSTTSTTSTTLSPLNNNNDDDYDGLCQCDYDGGCRYLAETDETRGDIATFLLVSFSFITLVVLFNLLTAMMATTYRLITERSDKEVLSRKVALGVEYDKNTQVMPPPFNMLVVLLFIVYSIIDALLLLFTQKFISESYGNIQWKCENCNCLNLYQKDDDDDSGDGVNLSGGLDNNDDDNISRTLSLSLNTNHVCQLCGKLQTNINPKRRFWRNPRQYSEGDGRWKTFVMGLKELLDIETKADKNSHNNKRSSTFKQHEKTVSSLAENNKNDKKNDNGIGEQNDEDIMDERMLMEKRIKRKDWICGYCRNRIPAGQLGDVETFKDRLFQQDIRVDEDDIEAIQQINSLLCPICYRVVSVRSRIIFIMEVISYYVFLFILYPIIRITLIPIYFFQAIYSITGSDDVNDDEHGSREKELDFLSGNSDNEQLKKLKEIEDLLPSDAHTRALLNPSHKIWKVLKHFQKKQNRIGINQDAKKANDEAMEAKRKKMKDDEKLQRQRGKIVAQLGALIDKYWKTRLAASEKHKLNAKRKQSQLLEYENLIKEIGEDY